MKKMNKGFTLVEIMIVVAIIGLLAAIAIPSFVKSRESARTSACVNNLRQIDSAKEQWAMANNAGNGDAGPALADLVGANNYIKKTPTCPAGGTYTVGAIGTDPSCSVAAHVL